MECDQARPTSLLSQNSITPNAVATVENQPASSQLWRQHWLYVVGLPLIILLAFGLRVYGLGNLALYGDYAYSVYAARQDWIPIAQERVLDGHPPFYYYLLHIWMLLFEQNELTLRMLSALIGVLVIPLTFAFGARQLGRRVGILGALLVAVSPALVHYSRLPRMYILLAMLALLSAYTLTRALDRDRRLDWLGYFFATSLLLYTHYYGLAVVVAEAAYVAWIHRRLGWPSRRFFAAMGALAIVYLPWLLFAAVGSARTTARIISNAPWPTDIQGVLEQYWVPINVGDFLVRGAALPLSLVMLVPWVLGLLLERRYLCRRWQELKFLVFTIVVPIAGSLIVFVFFPYAVRPRFLIFCIPPYLLLLATALSGKRRWLTVAGMAIALVISSYALLDMFRIEPYVVENDAIRLTERVQQTAQPEDAIVFQAFWQIGYFTTHYHGAAPRAYNMNDLSVENVEATLSKHPKVWLAMFRVPARTAEYPLEEWLDRNWHKAEELQIGETRLISYARPSRDAWQSTPFEFEAAQGGPILKLAAVQFGKTSVKPRGIIPVGLRWQALRLISERYTMFLQLIDSSGHRLAGADSEPLGGTEATAGWQEGRVVDDRMAVVVPADIPPGDYTLRAGVYPTGAPQPLMARGAAGSASTQGVDIGRLHVESYRAEELQIHHPLNQQLGDSITLLGYDLDIDSYEVGATRAVTTFADDPIRLTFPKRTYQASDTIEITLYWQALRSVNQDYTVFTHLQDSSGRLWGQSDGQPVMGNYPTSRWRVGEVVVDRYHLRIDPSAPPGDYQIKAGMYLFPQMRRVPVTTAPGTGDDVKLQDVSIDDGRYNPQTN